MADANAIVQFCMAHLIREVRFLAEHSNKSLSRRTFERRIEAARNGFLEPMRRPPPVAEARTLIQRIDTARVRKRIRVTMVSAASTLAPLISPSSQSRQSLDGGELFVLPDVGVGVHRQADVAVPGQCLSDLRRNAASC